MLVDWHESPELTVYQDVQLWDASGYALLGRPVVVVVVEEVAGAAATVVVVPVLPVVVPVLEVSEVEVAVPVKLPTVLSLQELVSDAQPTRRLAMSEA